MKELGEASRGTFLRRKIQSCKWGSGPSVRSVVLVGSFCKQQWSFLGRNGGISYSRVAPTQQSISRGNNWDLKYSQLCKKRRQGGSKMPNRFQEKGRRKRNCLLAFPTFLFRVSADPPQSCCSVSCLFQVVIAMINQSCKWGSSLSVYLFVLVGYFCKLWLFLVCPCSFLGCGGILYSLMAATQQSISCGNSWDVKYSQHCIQWAEAKCNIDSGPLERKRTLNFLE